MPNDMNGENEEEKWQSCACVNEMSLAHLLAFTLKGLLVRSTTERSGVFSLSICEKGSGSRGCSFIQAIETKKNARGPVAASINESKRKGKSTMGPAYCFQMGERERETCCEKASHAAHGGTEQ